LPDSCDGLDGVGDSPNQFFRIVGITVGQVPFSQGPDILIVVQLRNVERKMLEEQAAILAETLTMPPSTDHVSGDNRSLAASAPPNPDCTDPATHAGQIQNYDAPLSPRQVALPSTPATKTCRRGPRAFHPSDKDLSQGTPAFHPCDEDLSPGAPALWSRQLPFVMYIKAQNG
jgi:hypothetical protein